jgi:hypothetical protein
VSIALSTSSLEICPVRMPTPSCSSVARTFAAVERRYYEKKWAKWQADIDRGFASLGGMCGELQSIMGAALAPVELLQLPSATPEVLRPPSAEPRAA